MGKKRFWFGFLKRLFVCKAESTEKKVSFMLLLIIIVYAQIYKTMFSFGSVKFTPFKILFQGTKNRRWCFGILKMNHHYHALETPERKVNHHVEDYQKQHTKALAIAMTAAAEAAIAAANAAAELARLVSSPEDFQRIIRNNAAIKIQSFYRAHLVHLYLSLVRISLTFWVKSARFEFVTCIDLLIT